MIDIGSDIGNWPILFFSLSAGWGVEKRKKKKKKKKKKKTAKESAKKEEKKKRIRDERMAVLTLRAGCVVRADQSD
jgi:hypothetical protein